jgi:Kdo2-lipid IVA lauroyltransferase/acyltransferase
MLSALVRAVAMLPLPVLHGIGVLLGWVVYLASPAYRRQLRGNLKGAGYTDGATRWRAIAEAGKQAVEMPAIWFRPQAKVMRLIRRVEGRPLVEDAVAQGKGILFLTAHLGCFEITARLGAEFFPITVLYRIPRKGFLLPLIEAGRSTENVRLAPATMRGVRELGAALKRREAIGILPDQVPRSGEGEWADFFGRPAYTMMLAMRFSARPDTVTLLAYGERLPRGAGYVVHVKRFPEAEEGESPVRRLNRALEAMIRENPAQYLWGYNRYKSPPGAPPAPQAAPEQT